MKGLLWRRLTRCCAALLLGVAVIGVAHAAKDDPDVDRLNNILNQLAGDRALGGYAQAEQARAHDAVNQLTQARSRDERMHALYLAERRVELARLTAQLQVARQQVDQLDREHDQIQLEGTRREAELDRQELDRQRQRYLMAQEAAARQVAAGEEAAAQAQVQAAQAQAQAAQAQKVAAAQAKLANAAKKQAELATQAARAIRKQMQEENTNADSSTRGGSGK